MYNFRIPTNAQITFGDKNSLLDDWHSLHLLQEMAWTYGFRWIEEDLLGTLISMIAIKLKFDYNMKCNGFDWD